MQNEHLGGAGSWRLQNLAGTAQVLESDWTRLESWIWNFLAVWYCTMHWTSLSFRFSFRALFMSLLWCRCVGWASPFRHPVHDGVHFQGKEKRFTIRVTLCDLDGVAYLFPFLFPICADRTDASANKQRLPVAFLTRFQQNTLFCSLFLIGHFNKMLLKMDAIKSVDTGVWSPSASIHRPFIRGYIL